MKTYLQFVLRHRLAVLVAIALVTSLAGYSLSHGVIASSVIRLFFGDNPKYTAYRAKADVFSGTDVMVIAFEDPALVSPKGAERLTRITDAIRQLDFIARADSLKSMSRIRAIGDDLLIDGYLDQLETETATQVQAEILKDPFTGGWLASTDGKTHAVLVELTADKNRAIERLPQMLEQILAPFYEEGLTRDDLYLAGIVPESAEATSQARFTLERLFPVTVGILALVVFVLFLRIWPVIITGGVALIAIIWTFGLAVLIDPQINLMMAMVPGMITVIAFSDIIHLYSAFVRCCHQGMHQQDAVLKSGTEVGVACLFTSLTTFMGFASLVFIPTPLIRGLGVVLGAGVGIALLLALTLVPILLSFLPGIRPGVLGESRPSARILDGIVAFCMNLSLQHSRKVVFGFFLVAAACIYSSLQIEVEASFAGRLDPENRIRKSRELIKERFAGSSFLDIYIESQDGDLLEPATFNKVARFQRALLAMPEIDGVVSLVSLMDRIHRQMQPDVTFGEGYAVPDNRPLLAQYLLLFEVSGGEGLERLIDDDRQLMRLTVRVGTDGLREIARIGDDAARLGATHLEDAATVESTGIAYLLGDWVSFILDGQRRGLGFAVFTTALMMMLCLRSLRVGLISMLPNLLPLVVLGGVIGVAWDKVDSDTILVGTFAIGIAVDDTIHFLTRFRFESLAHSDPHVALQRTFVLTGRAIVQTTVILCLGFSPFAWSDYYSTWILGTLLPMTLVVALVADLLWVPALVNLGWLRFR